MTTSGTPESSPLSALFDADPAPPPEDNPSSRKIRAPAPEIGAARSHPALAALAARISSSFRLPGTHDPAPRPHRLVGMCAWAAALGLVGLAVAVRALLAIVTGIAPGWFKPAVIGTGLVGIALTVGGFMAVHQRRLPWALLGAASATLVVNLVVTISAL